MEFSLKLKIELLYHPLTPLLYINLKKTPLIQAETCAPVFVAALFIIAKIWKHSKYPLADEWLKMMWYRYTMGYYPVIKINEILPLKAI